MADSIYDVIIIGGGPGGYTAALYCVRSGLSALVIEKLSAGGQMAETEQVDNYPGAGEGVGGFELAERMREGAEHFGAQTLYAQAQKADLRANPKRITTDQGERLGRSVVLAMGAYPRMLGLDGEQELRGKGIAYCAACDGMAYRGKTVAVAGGGNSAVADALMLAKLCAKVYLIHRRDTLTASKIYLKALQENDVEILWNSRITRLLHDGRLTGVELAEVDTDRAGASWPATGFLWRSAGFRILGLPPARRRSTHPATLWRMRQHAPVFPAFSRWGTCAPSRCGRS